MNRTKEATLPAAGPRSRGPSEHPGGSCACPRLHSERGPSPSSSAWLTAASLLLSSRCGFVLLFLQVGGVLKCATGWMDLWSCSERITKEKKRCKSAPMWGEASVWSFAGRDAPLRCAQAEAVVLLLLCCRFVLHWFVFADQQSKSMQTGVYVCMHTFLIKRDSKAEDAKKGVMLGDNDSAIICWREETELTSEKRLVCFPGNQLEPRLPDTLQPLCFANRESWSESVNIDLSSTSRLMIIPPEETQLLCKFLSNPADAIHHWHDLWMQNGNGSGMKL